MVNVNSDILKSSSVPSIRVRALNSAPVVESGDFVLYWMIANRRTTWNFSLQRAVDWAISLKKPLVIFEAVRVNYHWASDRIHHFILQGMLENLRACAALPVLYYPYVEPKQQAARGLLEALSARACLVVSDDFPCFFLPTLLKVVSKKSAIRVEAVDSNGLFPMRAAPLAFPTAYAFRRHLQKNLPAHLNEFPRQNPLELAGIPRLESLGQEILSRWPAADEKLLGGGVHQLSGFAIDHSVPPTTVNGGCVAAQSQLVAFVKGLLPRYAEDRNDVDDEVCSGLSSYLHFGHLSSHEIFDRIARSEEWTPAELGSSTAGKKEGWWGMSPSAEAFLDQLTTWRELGYNMCVHRPDFDRYESLPEWALKTLEQHSNDPRVNRYSLEEFELAMTHDEIWNAAQRQLLMEGRIHNYLRMLWGKKILEWTESPQQALQFMVHLNNKYALDGRNPNSYSGIFWVLGRYDRAWGPERPIYGKIRYMSSDNTRRKLNLKNYLANYSAWKYRNSVSRR
ncbi:deoxyribodipyrimidine photolyase [Planctomicrobium sp. SH668]|uniref:deoxyribodipyrimidine photolyase n=1 Tax=Planctomicrobium sp. SH668 TaxID=3448126 RepID=UPI003F5B828B